MAPLEIEAANSRNRTGSYQVVPTTRDRNRPFSRVYHMSARKFAPTCPPPHHARKEEGGITQPCSQSNARALWCTHPKRGNAPTNLMGSRGRTTNSLSTLASELRKVNTKKTIQRPFLPRYLARLRDAIAAAVFISYSLAS